MQGLLKDIEFGIFDIPSGNPSPQNGFVRRSLVPAKDWVSA
jgi:hypothetical protein